MVANFAKIFASNPASPTQWLIQSTLNIEALPVSIPFKILASLCLIRKLAEGFLETGSINNLPPLIEHIFEHNIIACEANCYLCIIRVPRHPSDLINFTPTGVG
jgi:hypothetical protein